MCVDFFDVAGKLSETTVFVTKMSCSVMIFLEFETQPDDVSGKMTGLDS